VGYWETSIQPSRNGPQSIRSRFRWQTASAPLVNTQTSTFSLPTAIPNDYMTLMDRADLGVALVSSRGTLRPFCISAAYLFDAHRLHAETRRQDWHSHERACSAVGGRRAIPPGHRRPHLLGLGPRNRY
jgi:hypothetical protein